MRAGHLHTSTLTGILSAIVVVILLATAGCNTSHETLRCLVLVQDDNTKAGIEGAKVTVYVEMGENKTASYSKATNQNGRAEFNLPVSQKGHVAWLTVEKAGYESYRGEYFNLEDSEEVKVCYLVRKETDTGNINPPTTSTGEINAPTSKVETSVPLKIEPTTPSPTVISHVPKVTDTPSPPTLIPTRIPPPRPLIQLSIRDLWPVGTGCQIGGTWWADLWIQPTGGDGHYKYYINGDWKADSIEQGVTIHLTSPSCTAIVGTASVESGGTIVSEKFYVPVPACCQ